MITGYTVTSSPAGGIATGASSPLTVTGLTNGTAYTFTVVATNAVGSSAASAASSAVTPAPAATVPGAPTSVVATAGNTTASVAFVVPSSNGGSVITGYTVTSNPAGGTATGASSPLTVTGLTNGTAYTFTVVATNGVGNSVASAASAGVTPAAPFTCGTSVSDIDMNSYTTVSIGTQCWTATNLRVRRYNDGTEIRFDTSGTTTGSSSQTWSGTGREYGAHTIYAHDSATTSPSNLTSYGYLYNWYAAKGIYKTGVIASTDTLNICPVGWHVPTDSDWNNLVKFIDSGANTTSATQQSTTAGTKLKKDDALWTTNSGNDDSGFSALPGGLRASSASFINIRNFAYFWSATEKNTTYAWYRYLVTSIGSVFRESINSKSLGVSVRCLRD